MRDLATECAFDEAGLLANEVAESERSKIENEDLSPNRVRQQIIYTRQDVVMIVSMMKSVHGQLSTIRQQAGAIVIMMFVTMVAVIVACFAIWNS